MKNIERGEYTEREVLMLDDECGKRWKGWTF